MLYPLRLRRRSLYFYMRCKYILTHNDSLLLCPQRLPFRFLPLPFWQGVFSFYLPQQLPQKIFCPPVPAYTVHTHSGQPVPLQFRLPALQRCQRSYVRSSSSKSSFLPLIKSAGNQCRSQKNFINKSRLKQV